jgi:glycosyltransferase involved in cell wall biosynthesis
MLSFIDKIVRYLLANCPQVLYDYLKVWKYRELGKKLSKYAKKSQYARLSMQEYSVCTDNRSLTIVVPCFNHCEFLEDTFDCLINQTCKDFDLILIDDKSNDKTNEILSRYVNGVAWKSCTLLSNNINIGQAASLNRAIEIASTSHIMILNDDDYLMLDSVEFVLSIIKKYPDIQMIGSCFVQHDSRANSIRMLENNQKIIAERYKICKEEIEIEEITPEALLTSPDLINFYDISHTGCTFSKYAWEFVGGYYPLAKRFVSYTDRDFQIRVASCFSVGRINNCALNFWRTYSSLDNSLNS